METLDHKKLLFRRQYLYAPDRQFYADWQHVKLPNGSMLSVHPDLKITECLINKFHLFLLGYILDPVNPEFSDQEVLDSIIGNADGTDAILEFLEDKGGRYVLFIFAPDKQIVVDDACGLRQVFFARDQQGSIWLSSQPTLIAQNLNLSYSDEAKQFINSPEYRSKLEAWWPGDCTPYEEVVHLLPNHYLNLATGNVTRFWPNKKLKQNGLRKGVDESSRLLRGIMASANNRSPIALSFTAGFDSRVLLAACKEFSQDLFIFSMVYRKLTDKSLDINVPHQITKNLRLEHRVVYCPKEIPSDFEEIYNTNTQGYKTDWINIVKGRYDSIPSDYVIIKGSAASIARCSYWPDGVYPFRMTLRRLMQLSGFGKTKFVVEAQRKWMIDALSCEKLGYKVLDLFAWENEAGNWQGMSHSIFDLAHDEYCPFSNRKLLNIMLGVNPKYRCLPHVVLEQKIIQKLWPDLLRFPIHTSWNEGKKKKFYDGKMLNLLRWVKYFLSGSRYGRLDE